MYTLHLTAKEKKFFDKLPRELTKGQVTEIETITYENTMKRRNIRLKQLAVTEPGLQRFLQTAALATSEKEFLSMMSVLDLGSVSGQDIAEIVFAIGPDGVGFLIAQILEHAKSASELDLAVALSLLRHEMLISLVAPTPV